MAGCVSLPELTALIQSSFACKLIRLYERSKRKDLWFFYEFSLKLSVTWFVWLIDCLLDWLIIRIIVRLIDCPLDWLIIRGIVRLFDRSIDWLIDWFWLDVSLLQAHGSLDGVQWAKQQGDHWGLRQGPAHVQTLRPSRRPGARLHHPLQRYGTYDAKRIPFFMACRVSHFQRVIVDLFIQKIFEKFQKL